MKRLPDSAWRTPLTRESLKEIIAYYGHASGREDLNISARRAEKLIRDSHDIHVGDTAIADTGTVGAWIFEVGLVTMLDEVVPVKGSIYHAVKNIKTGNWAFLNPGVTLELHSAIFEMTRCKVISEKYESENLCKRDPFTTDYLSELHLLRLQYEEYNYGV